MSQSYGGNNNQYNTHRNYNDGNFASRGGGGHANTVNNYDNRDRDSEGGRRKRSTSRSRSRSDSRERKRKGSVNYGDRDGNYGNINNHSNNYGNQRNYGYNNNNGGYRENDRVSGHGAYNEHRGFGSNERNNSRNFSNNISEPSTTVVIKGLPPQTTEHTLQAILAPFYPRDLRVIMQRDGECKGFAFVEFPSLEYSQYFMTTYAGSAGDPNAPQLIVENRSVSIEYGREQADRRGKEDHNKRDDKTRSVKTDWLCEACACHNFSRRDSCYRCNLPRSERSVSVTAAADNFGDSLVTSDVPSAFLVVRGFGPNVSEEQIAELFRRFALVKSTVLIRDQQGRVTKSSMAFVEFHSVEHAAYALQCSADIEIDTNVLKISFAKESVMHQIVTQYQIMLSSAPAFPPVVPMMHMPHHPVVRSNQPNALVATALQAAQWSMNNGYGGMSGSSGPSVAATSASVKPKQIWPKHFETNGAAYIFQPKTGYFLDNVTEFFYCPKSKLYYSAKDGIYYHFDLTLDPPFKRFDPPIPTEEDTTTENKTTEEAATTASRAPISLSLGLKGKSGKAGGLANPAAKKAMLDIAKWGAIQKDDEEEAETDNANNTKSVPTAQVAVEAEKKSTIPPISTGSNEDQSASTSIPEKLLPDSINLSSPPPTGDVTLSATKPTSTATFICKLCKRQFNSAEMLSRHEKESKLHAENLAKQKAAAAAAAPRQYRDRAEERREKFGSVPDHIPPPPILAASGVSSGTSNISLPQVESVAPVHFDESNPGNQMLRKMGWKEGQGLGKDGEGREEAIGVEMAAGKNTNTSMHSTLKSTVGTTGGGANASMSYKECVKAASLARFEQLQRSEGK